MNENELVEALSELGINVSKTQLEKLNLYYELLIEWNQKINLTRIVAKEEVYLKHFYDSLTLVKAIDLNKIETLCDVGTGAGFPGIVLKIFFPNLKVTLIDSLQKRINFLNVVIEKLNLTGIETIHTRGEDYARCNRECFDIVTCRAVSHLRIISEISLPMVKTGGYFIPMKANVDNEIVESTSTLTKLNSQIEKQITFYLPIEGSLRNLLKIKKLKPTDKKYPRSSDKIKKLLCKN